MQKQERRELLGCIIDIFEDYLEENNITIPNEEREEDDDSAAIIYGSHYDFLADQIEEILITAGVLESEDENHE